MESKNVKLCCLTRIGRHASLHQLAEDLGETQDLSETHSERKEQLFAAYQDYFATRRLKPLAELVLAKKTQKKAPSSSPAKPKRDPGPGRPKPGDTRLTAEQKALAAEFQKRRAELQRQQLELLSEEQQQSRDAARRQAIEAGKKGVALRAATDAGSNLTETQKREIDELRDRIRRLTAEHRQELEKRSNAKP